MTHRNATDPAGAEALAREALAARALPIPMSAEQRQAWQDRFNAIPGMSYLGCTLDISDEHVVAVHLPEVEAHHQGGLGTDAVNGAVLAGFFDCALGVAGVIQFPGQRAGTVELSIKFLRPTRGDSLTAYAVALKRTKNLCFVESELYCGHRLCAVATGMVSTASQAG